MLCLRFSLCVWWHMATMGVADISIFEAVFIAGIIITIFSYSYTANVLSQLTTTHTPFFSPFWICLHAFVFLPCFLLCPSFVSFSVGTGPKRLYPDFRPNLHKSRLISPNSEITSTNLIDPNLLLDSFSEFVFLLVNQWQQEYAVFPCWDCEFFWWDFSYFGRGLKFISILNRVFLLAGSTPMWWTLWKHAKLEIWRCF